MLALLIVLAAAAGLISCRVLLTTGVRPRPQITLAEVFIQIVGTWALYIAGGNRPLPAKGNEK